MRQALHRLAVETRGQGLVEITALVKDWLAHLDIEDGLLTLYCRHTSASLLIQENADPDVCRDLESFFARIAPEGRGLYVHQSEGPDDMPAHIRAALTQTQLSVPIQAGQLLLGTWQGLYLFEHRRAPHQREIVLYVIGE
ncbi:secondary thiamine-phosphate synthase enzyme YjbQ [uncultured Methylovirgula sp.]|uniref:secondary thiamine-phosphate synthase enzyme YjbQ n=1 Tax=uncultured Methylovirgula sp. TaxID=1285960 RepID=UPI0026335A11|nr:secondary thiamine-phosphate synthase enzyme YjbQ [uncultured Methylovirgula sp.]